MQRTLNQHVDEHEMVFGTNDLVFAELTPPAPRVADNAAKPAVDKPAVSMDISVQVPVETKKTSTKRKNRGDVCLIPIECINMRTWSPDAIAKFKVANVDFAAEFAKAKKLAPHLRPGHTKRIQRDLAEFAHPLVTILATEAATPFERKRFPPLPESNGAVFQIASAVFMFVNNLEKLKKDMTTSHDIESMLNSHGDHTWRLPVDGKAVTVHSSLSVIFRIKQDTVILVTAGAEPSSPAAARPLRRSDDELSDPKAPPTADEFRTMAQAMSAVIADDGQHARTQERRATVVGRLLADEARQNGKKQLAKTPFFVWPIELFWFMTNFFLTARDCSHLSGTCVFAFHAIHSNVKYWKRAFQCLGNIPLYVNVGFLENDVVPIRRWSITAMIKRRQEQRVHDYNNQVAIACRLPEERDRSARLNSLKAQFLQKRHACPLCFNPVSFQYQLNSSISKKNGFGAVFMACDQCCIHNVWSHTQALIIWGFTEGQLQHLARYTLSAMKFYSTADLLWLRERKFPLYTKSISEAALTPGQRARLVDLPVAVALQLRLREQTVDARGIIWERTLNVGTRAIVVAQRPILDSDEPYEMLLEGAFGKPQQTDAPLQLEAPGRQRDGQPLSKRARLSPTMSAADEADDVPMTSAGAAGGPKTLRLAPSFDVPPTLPGNVGSIGSVPAAAFLAGGTNPTFVAYHGSEPAPVLASSIQYPIAKRSSYVHCVFDPQLDARDVAEKN